MGGKRAKHELSQKNLATTSWGLKLLDTEEMLKAKEYSLVVRRVGNFKAYKAPRTNQIFYVNEKENTAQLSKPVGWDDPGSMEVATISVDELLQAADVAYENALDVRAYSQSTVTVMPEYGRRCFGERSRKLQDSIEINWDKINLSTGKPEENPTLLIKYDTSSASTDGGKSSGVSTTRESGADASSKRSSTNGMEHRYCDDDLTRQRIIHEPSLPLRQLRAPFRVRILGAERELPTHPFYQLLNKRGDLEDQFTGLVFASGFLHLVKVPSDWMETSEEPVAKRQFIGFGPSRWMETKIFMHNICSSTRVVFQLMAHMKDDKGKIVSEPAASAALGISDLMVD